MDSLLQGIPKVCTYLDDMLITNAMEAEHLQEVLNCLEQAGTYVHVFKKDKCAFCFLRWNIWVTKFPRRASTLLRRKYVLSWKLQSAKHYSAQIFPRDVELLK